LFYTSYRLETVTDNSMSAESVIPRWRVHGRCDANPKGSWGADRLLQSIAAIDY